MARRARAGRTVSRIILGGCFVLAVLGGLIATVPFTRALTDGDVARCGPPAFEVLVPADPTFDAVENEVCPSPARSRLVLGLVLIAVAGLAAIVTEWRVRSSTSDAHAGWLQERPRRDRRRRRRAETV